MSKEPQLGSTPSIRASRVRREDDQTLHYAFTVELEDGSERPVVLSQALSVKQLVKELRSFSSDLPEIPGEAEGIVRGILADAGDDILTGVVHPGWKEEHSTKPTFVAPAWCRGARCSSYVWLNALEPGVLQSAGSHGLWLARVASPCAESTYLSFALMLSLSGPLLVFADDLSEGAVFHLYGDTSTGKTTAARVAASLFRSPDDLPGWSQTPRTLEELASNHRDHLLILNAAEKVSDHEQKDILRSLTHRITEGRGKSRSKSVQHMLPNLTARSPVLSTGNDSGATMALNAKLKWSPQDQARFISIPVPTAAAGGVVDLVKGTDHAAPGFELIGQLENALRANYGRSLRRWVRLAWLHREQVNGLIAEFVSKVGASSSHERRIAHKFGLVYAAGTIAVNAGFLASWKGKAIPLRATTRLFELAMSDMDAGSPTQHLQALVDALQRLPNIGTRDHLTLGTGQPFLGVKFKREGTELIGLRAEALHTIVPGQGASYTLLRSLDEAGILEKGHGGKRAQQVNLAVINAEGKTIHKPRLLVMEAKKLELLRTSR